MNKQQLEIALAGNACARRRAVKRRRAVRAQWWFERMRRAVDAAAAPPPAPRARQTPLPLAPHRQAA